MLMAFLGSIWVCPAIVGPWTHNLRILFPVYHLSHVVRLWEFETSVVKNVKSVLLKFDKQWMLPFLHLKDKLEHKDRWETKGQWEIKDPWVVKDRWEAKDRWETNSTTNSSRVDKIFQMLQCHRIKAWCHQINQWCHRTTSLLCHKDKIRIWCHRISPRHNQINLPCHREANLLQDRLQVPCRKITQCPHPSSQCHRVKVCHPRIKVRGTCWCHRVISHP